MTDNLTAAQRRRTMQRVRSKDTTPERVVRSLVHRLGYRFRLHRGDLPGKPDLVLPRLQKVIFVHGCFWHRHGCSAGRSTPASNQAYWLAKFERNRLRDATARRKLRRAGWTVLVVWECQTKPAKRAVLERKLRQFLRK